MTRARALVQRPGRRIHLATIAPGETTWLTVCDRDVPVFGITEHGRDWPAWLTAAQTPDVPVCARCRTPLLLAALALAEVEDVRASNADRDALAEQVRTLETETRALRAEIARWVTAAIGETRAAAARRFRAVGR